MKLLINNFVLQTKIIEIVGGQVRRFGELRLGRKISYLSLWPLNTLRQLSVVRLHKDTSCPEPTDKYPCTKQNN